MQSYNKSISEVKTYIASSAGNPDLFLSDVLGNLPIHVLPAFQKNKKTQKTTKKPPRNQTKNVLQSVILLEHNSIGHILRNGLVTE